MKVEIQKIKELKCHESEKVCKLKVFDKVTGFWKYGPVEDRPFKIFPRSDLKGYANFWTADVVRYHDGELVTLDAVYKIKKIDDV